MQTSNTLKITGGDTRLVYSVSPEISRIEIERPEPRPFSIFRRPEYRFMCTFRATLPAIEYSSPLIIEEAPHVFVSWIVNKLEVENILWKTIKDAEGYDSVREYHSTCLYLDVPCHFGDVEMRFVDRQLDLYRAVVTGTTINPFGEGDSVLKVELDAMIQMPRNGRIV